MNTIILPFILLFTSASALKCYVCTISASDTSDTCVQNPGAVSTGSPTVDCGVKYCTITRQEYKDPPGKIASFYRGCENNPVYHNTMIEDADFKTYFRSCSSDLCNTGNGIQSVGGGNLGAAGGSVGNLLVPGIDAGNAIRTNFAIIIFTIILTIFLNNT